MDGAIQQHLDDNAERNRRRHLAITLKLEARKKARAAYEAMFDAFMRRKDVCEHVKTRIVEEPDTEDNGVLIDGATVEYCANQACKRVMAVLA